MHSLQKQFHDFFHANHLIEKGEKVLLAVSGGLDSMVMAKLFLDEKVDFDIAHCNFGLRGSESDGDEAFVLRWADENGINCFVKTFELEGKSTQIEARNMRYQWFNELLLEHGHDKIATAHHLNDSLETVLINLTRGTGIKGMSGISVINQNIIRPLLFAEKKDLLMYAMDQKMEWREDSSNRKMDYDRNFIRQEIIPELEKLNPSLHRTFFLTAERLNHAEDVIKTHVESIKEKYLSSSNSSFSLDLSWIHKSSDVLILSEILNEFGVNYVTCKEIFEARDKAGKSFPVKGWLITMDRDALFIDKNINEESISFKIEEPGVYQLNEDTYRVNEVAKDEVIFHSNNCIFLDADKVKFPLVARMWEEGDKFQPLGMTGTKKVSDLLIDEKVPLARKKDIFILESDGQIIWVIGYRIADFCRITESTKRVLKVGRNI